VRKEYEKSTKNRCSIDAHARGALDCKRKRPVRAHRKASDLSITQRAEEVYERVPEERIAARSWRAKGGATSTECGKDAPPVVNAFLMRTLSSVYGVAKDQPIASIPCAVCLAFGSACATRSSAGYGGKKLGATATGQCNQSSYWSGRRITSIHFSSVGR
jgi:hypothetical protein